ncbi:MAG: M56 family metallopeptidase [Gemmatimonadetes bacterium]|nr:M56 family metallopeptidase [Gemmatimonadota bacterium]
MMAIDLLSPADSARAVAGAYNTSLLLAAIPLLGGVGIAVVGRRLSRGATALAWRVIVMAMAAVTLGALCPTSWRAWVLPELLVAPLQSLGTVEPGAAAPARWPQLAVLVWAIGAAAMLGRWIRAQRSLAVSLRDAVPCADLRWKRAALRAMRTVPTARPVRLLVSHRVRVPMAVGWWNPAVVVPSGLEQLSAEERVAILVHERAHIASGDPWIGVLLRALGVVGWFHPGVWMATVHATVTAEGAADEWVLATGVRPSTYASLLGLRAWPEPGQLAIGLGGRGALRQRLRWITSGVATPLPRLNRQRLAMALAGLLAFPLGTVQLAPTRGALDGMMQRDRWESRAFAVARLALRADTVAVAQAAAVSDPSPQVRAAARAALARAGQRRLPRSVS